MARGREREQAGQREGGRRQHAAQRQLRCAPEADRQRTGDGPHAQRRHEKAEALGAQAQHVPRQQRHVHGEVEDGDADDEEHAEHEADHRRARSVAEALGDLFQHRRAPPGGHAPARQRQQREPDGQDHERVDDERRRDAEAGDDQARHRRPHDARGVERGRIERDGVDEVGLAHYLGHVRLAGGHVERLRQAGQHRHDADVPVPHAPGHDQCRQHQGEHRQGELRDDEDAALGQPVSERAGDDREEQDRPELQRADEPESQGRVGELQDQPGLRHRVHPAGHERRQLRHEEPPEVAVVEGAQAARKDHGLRRRIAGPGCGP